jgi:hypothetical protein
LESKRARYQELVGLGASKKIRSHIPYAAIQICERSSKLTMVRVAARRVGTSWSVVMVSLAVCAAVSRSARHDNDLNDLNK